MTPNVFGIAANLIANFVMVVIPAPTWAWNCAEVSHHLTLDDIQGYRMRLRRELCRHGETRSLDCIEIDALGNWRIHFFPLNQEAISVLRDAAGNLSEVAWGMGEAASFDPKEFVMFRLDRLEQQGRLRAREPWWIDEFAHSPD